MTDHKNRIFIIEAKRSAIGKFLGSLYEADPAEVCSQVIRKGFSKFEKNMKDVENVIVGNVISAGSIQRSTYGNYSGKYCFKIPDIKRGTGRVFIFGTNAGNRCG